MELVVNKMRKSFNLYTYIYYQFYRFFSSGWGGIAKYWRPSAVLGVLEVWLLNGVANIVGYITNTKMFVSHPAHPTVVLMIISLVSIHYFCFHHNNGSQKIVAQYDELPEKTNRLGGWLIFAGILLSSWFVIESFQIYATVAKGLN